MQSVRLKPGMPEFDSRGGHFASGAGRNHPLHGRCARFDPLRKHAMETTKQKRARKARERYHAKRLAWIDSQGGKCKLCGSAERLEVDHINREDKSIHASLVWSRRAEVRDAELAKCQVLCYNCHRKKTNKENKVHRPCGDYVKYRHHGCRCSDCTLANTEYQRQFNKPN